MSSILSSSHKRRVNTSTGQPIPASPVRNRSKAPSLRLACTDVIAGTSGRGGLGFMAIAATAALFGPLEAARAQGDNTGLLGQYFNIAPANINGSDPNFNTFTSLQTHLSSGVPALIVDNSPTLNFQTNGSAFPAPYNVNAVNLESFYSGLLNIGTAGLYTFNTSSDDGSMLFIDGQTVVNNNFSQGVTTRTGTITLSAGYHNIAVGYYEGGGGFGLNAQISGPGDTAVVDLDLNNPNAKLTPDIVMPTLSGAAPLALPTGNVITGQDNIDTTYSGVLSGIGGVTKWGAGTLTLTGANTNTGANIIAVGTLVGHTGSLKGNVINAGALVFDQSLSTPAPASNDYAGVISGAGSVTKVNAGTVNFTGANTYSGPTVISGGTLASNTAGLASTSRVTINNATLRATAGGLALRAPVTVTGVGTIDTNGNDSRVYSTVEGAGGFVKSGAGTLTLSDFSTYTGPTTITGGTLKLNPLQPGLNEGHLLNNSFDVTNPIPPTNITLGTPKSESNAAPDFVDNSTWGYTGYILNPSSTNVTWTFAENFDDSVLLKIDGVTVLNDTAWNSPTKANYTLTPGRHVLEARFGQGGGGVGPSNQGWFTGGIGFGYDSLGRNEAVATNYVPVTDPGDGSLLNLGYGALPATSAVVMSANTTLDVTSAVQTIGSLADAAGGATGQTVIIGAAALTIGSDNTSTTFSGSITGAGTLTKIGTGTQSLGGASNYTGATTLNAGGLNLNNPSAIGTGPLVINGGSIGNTGLSDVTLTTNNTQTWAGNFSYTGNKNLNLGTGNVTLTGTRQVTVNSNTLTVGGVISGAGAGLTKAGPGILILKSPATYTGNTLVSGGTLKLENAGANILSSSPVLTVGTGATLDVTGLSGGGITLTGTETLNGNGTVLGGVTTVSGSTVSPGTGNIGVLTVGNLTLVSGAKLSYWLGGSTFGGVIAVNGNLVLPSSGLNLLLFDDANASGKGSIPAAGTYTLFTYTGTATGFNAATTFATQPGRTYTFTNTANKITLTLAIQSLTWTGQTGGNGAANSIWSPVPTNWANGSVATS
ncbi:MAG: Extracellular serine protease precursor, partial [Chthoniobacteraceae bacterium]|nr:Extracellular serine protease precursor [Chthoniobacteraceae bacterium]